MTSTSKAASELPEKGIARDVVIWQRAQTFSDPRHVISLVEKGFKVPGVNVPCEERK